MSEFFVTSPDFQEGGEIPKEFGYKFENKTTEINFNNLPKGTKCVALIMDDPDAMAAVGKVWGHWLYYTHQQKASQIFGKTDFGETKYGGPAPPDKRHTYVFKLYALDSELDLPGKSTKADVEKAMEGHIIEQATLTGTYAP